MLDAIRRGATVEAAAEAIGTTDRSVYRFAEKNGAFRIALNGAQAEGERALAAAGSGGLLVEHADAEIIEALPKDSHVGPPSADARLAASVLGVDVDLVANADAAMPMVDGVPAMTVHNVLAYCWRKMHDDKAPGGLRSTCTQIVAKVTFEPLLNAQRRRDEAETRRQLAAASVGEEAEVTVGSSTGAPFILVAPSNGREAPGRAPQAPEVEVIDAEVVA